jgi:hypothetical protein
LDAFTARNRPDLVLRQQFDGCTALQQAVLLEVAAGAKHFSKYARTRIGRRCAGSFVIAPVSVHNALVQLASKGLLVKSPQRGQYVFEDDQRLQWVSKVAQNAVADSRA